MTTSVDRLLHQCCAEIERRAERVADTKPILAEGAAAFRDALDTCSVKHAELTTVEVTGQLTDMESTPLASVMVAAADEMPWIAPGYLKDRGTEVGIGVINAVRDLGNVQCGIAVVAANSRYPEHRHDPQEIYLPISGDGRWRYGGESTYRELAADALVYNNPKDLHGLIAGPDPLVAMFVLWD